MQTFLKTVMFFANSCHKTPKWPLIDSYYFVLQFVFVSGVQVGAHLLQKWLSMTEFAFWGCLCVKMDVACDIVWHFALGEVRRSGDRFSLSVLWCSFHPRLGSAHICFWNDWNGGVQHGLEYTCPIPVFVFGCMRYSGAISVLSCHARGLS